MEIDLLIMGSSRPQLLKHTVRTFKKYVEYLADTKFRYLLHEDIIYPKKSQRSIEIATKLGIKPYVTNFPGQGLSLGMTYMFQNICHKSKYVFYLQDDWEFERYIDIDRVIWTMNRHNDINLVFFSHQKTDKYHDNLNVKFKSQEVNYDGLKLCTYNGWPFLPGIWRMSVIKKMWKKIRVHRPEGHFTNLFGTHDQRESNEYCRKHIGAYYYGHLGDYRYTRHLGTTWRMAAWQRDKEGQPTGSPHFDLLSMKQRAPWLSEIEARPVNKIKLTKRAKEIISGAPKELVEKFVK